MELVWGLVLGLELVQELALVPAQALVPVLAQVPAREPHRQQPNS